MQLTQLLASIWFGLRDLGVAAYEILLRRKRSLYVASIDIRAPRARVWEILSRTDVTFEASGLRSIQTAIPERPKAFIAAMSVNGQPFGRIGCEYLLVEPGERLAVRYLPDHTDAHIQIGDDDYVIMALSDLPDGGTRLYCSREITHRTLSTRILAPLGLRSSNWMTRAQAELEVGAPLVVPRWWHHVLWSIAAFASFALLFDMRVAAILLGVIAVHETGHALAMLHYGLGVRLVSFIPFFGGVAVPQRAATSEWQTASVALAGVGFSLPFVAACAWYADQFDDRLARDLALFGAFVNAANLLPVPGLDGSTILATLLRKVHRFASQGLAWVMFGAFAAFALTTRDPVMLVLVAFSLVVLVQSSVLNTQSQLTPMSPMRSGVLLGLYIATTAAYAALCLWAVSML